MDPEAGWQHQRRTRPGPGQEGVYRVQPERDYGEADEAIEELV